MDVVYSYCLCLLVFLGQTTEFNAQQFPKFVTKVNRGQRLHGDTIPTFQDMDLFMGATFSVGNSHVALDSNATETKRMLDAFNENSKLPPRLDCYKPTDCADIQLCGATRNGIYRIYPFGVGHGFLVSCDLEHMGGGWTLIQRRLDGSVDFNRGWDDYMAGFGNLLSEFWMGLHRLNQLTSQCQTELVVRMSDYIGESAWAMYEQFYVSDEASKCRLFVRGYSGSAGDSMQLHSGMMFSTPDSDNDISQERHCARDYGAGWWFGKCANVNLNGVYSVRDDVNPHSLRNVMWYTWKKRNPLQWVHMKIRPSKFKPPEKR